MDNRYYVLLAGDGESSRANTEALMEDYFYAKGKDGVLVLPFDTNPSKSQVLAAMYANEKKMDLIYVCNFGANTAGLPAGSMKEISVNNKTLPEALDFIMEVGGDIFVLGKTAGDDSFEIVAYAKNNELRCFDLCEGLIEVASGPTKRIKYTEEEISTLLNHGLISKQEAIVDFDKQLDKELEAISGLAEGAYIPKPLSDAISNLIHVAKRYGIDI